MPRGRLGRAVRALIWLLIALAIACGTAGIVTGAALPPGDATRPELTVRADERLEPGLGAIEEGMRQLAGDLDQLVAAGKTVLTDLTAQTSDRSTSADVAAQLDAGDALVLSITQRSQALQAAYAQLPYDASSDGIGGRSRGRLLAVRAALGGLGPVAEDWRVASARATVTARLVELLREHDQVAFEAYLLASAEDLSHKPKTPDFASATASIKEALALLAQASAIRDQLRQTLDVSTVSDWLDRNGTWDRAFQTYVHLAQTSRDQRVLDAAYQVEEKAKGALPKTTAQLEIVVGELVDSGLAAALTDLRQIRASLSVVARVD